VELSWVRYCTGNRGEAAPGWGGLDKASRAGNRGRAGHLAGDLARGAGGGLRAGKKPKKKKKKHGHGRGRISDAIFACAGRTARGQRRGRARGRPRAKKGPGKGQLWGNHLPIQGWASLSPPGTGSSGRPPPGPANPPTTHALISAAAIPCERGGPGQKGRVGAAQPTRRPEGRP